RRGGGEEILVLGVHRKTKRERGRSLTPAWFSGSSPNARSHARPWRRSSDSLRRIFFRAWMALRLRLTEGFSKCWRFLSSVRIPDFSTFRLKRRRAFSKLSSSRTCTNGIQTHLSSLVDWADPTRQAGAS